MQRRWNETDLRRAIEYGEILAYFQPVTSLADGRVGGFEALARWIHPVLGLVPPDDFIPVAEQSGLIGGITDAILRAGCRAAAGWDPAATLSINLSPVELRDPALAERLVAILGETGFAPRRLIVEIVERAMTGGDPLAPLRAAGIQIALVDCSAGTALERLRFDHIKIASALVQSMPGSREAVRAIAGFGKSLGARVTAEGVETRETAEALRAIGCDLAQGYLFGAPEPLHS